MELDKEVRFIEIFYDGHCGVCSSFVEWLTSQDRAIEVRCLAYQSDEAQRVFPEINSLKPDQEMVVRTDTGEVFRGAEGWVWCLWSCAKYKDIAKLMNSKLMLPVAKKVCLLASKNRLKLSKLFFGKKAKEVSDEIHSLDDDTGECADGSCDTNNPNLGGKR